MRTDATTALAVIMLLTIMGLYLYFHFTRARLLLERWAADNRYRLVRAEHRIFRKGPFFWSGRGQAVYRVEICDEHGNDRQGWVRCGTWFVGVFADKVEVSWDE